MHLAAFTASDKHTIWLRGHFISEQRRRKTCNKMRRRFRDKEALEIVMQPSSDSELQDSWGV